MQTHPSSPGTFAQEVRRLITSLKIIIKVVIVHNEERGFLTPVIMAAELRFHEVRRDLNRLTLREPWLIVCLAAWMFEPRT